MWVIIYYFLWFSCACFPYVSYLLTVFVLTRWSKGICGVYLTFYLLNALKKINKNSFSIIWKSAYTSQLFSQVFLASRNWTTYPCSILIKNFLLFAHHAFFIFYYVSRICICIWILWLDIKFANIFQHYLCSKKDK